MTAALLLGIPGALVVWYVHVRLYPMKDCPRCGGSRRNRSWDAHRVCTRCGGKGEVRRWGAPREER